MLAVLSWWLFSTLLGLVSLPLAWRLFGGLPSRGYAVARTLGLLLWGYLFWLPASLGLLQNDASGLLFALTLLVAFSLWAGKDFRQHWADWWTQNRRLVIRGELAFVLAFVFMVIVRAAAPEALGTEKPMELAFINAILRSPVLPPHDPWLSGFAISYYYFGYLLAAMLASLTSVSGSVAFNLMLALVFALAAQGSYGVLSDLLRLGRKDDRHAWLGPLFLLLVSNLEGFLEVLHSRGLFWSESGFNFWRWLDMKELSQPPAQPLGWLPQRFWFWWRASRVIQDYDLAGRFQEVIDEFPAFSFVLGDLHPHVMALPFGVLTVAFALHLYARSETVSWDWRLPLPVWRPAGDEASPSASAPRRGWTQLSLGRLYLLPQDFLFMAVLLGGMAFLNTWDLMAWGVLLGGVYLLTVARRLGWQEALISQAFLLGVPLLAASLLLYTPFYLGFSSQAGGLLPNLTAPTRGAHLWVMFGTLWLPLLVWLAVKWRHTSRTERRQALCWTLLVAAGLFLLSILLGVVAVRVQPDFIGGYLAVQGYAPNDFGLFLLDALLRRVRYLGGLLSLLVIFWLALGRVLALPRHKRLDGFVAALVLLGAGLVLLPEFVYLRDQFGTRMNTIFKFYYQAWLVWSLAAAYGAAALLSDWHGRRLAVWKGILTVVLLVGLTYPLLAFPARTHNFSPPSGWTLDAADYLHRQNPDEDVALDWLRQTPVGVVAEAVGGSYSQYARVSTLTGQPAVLGWPGHEVQWRGTAEPQGTRQADVQMLYESGDWQTALMIIQRYNIRYIFVGALERSTYAVDDAKFRRFARAYDFGSVTIYETSVFDTEKRVK